MSKGPLGSGLFDFSLAIDPDRPGVAFSYAAAGKHKQVKKRYKIQGIRDAERPNGLYERNAIGALWASLYELRPNKSLEEQPCGL